MKKKKLSEEERQKKQYLEKSVSRYLPDGTLICTYSHLKLAAYDNFSTDDILSCCLQNLEYPEQFASYKNFVWFFAKAPAERRPVHQYTLDGSYLKTYISYREASKQTDIHPSQLLHALKTHGSAGSYQWRYADERKNTDDISAYQRTPSSKQKPIHSYDKDGTYLETFDCIAHAAASVGAHPSRISVICHRQNGLCGEKQFRFAEDFPAGVSIAPHIAKNKAEKSEEERIQMTEQNRKYRTSVRQYTQDGICIATYTSIPRAAAALTEQKNIKISVKSAAILKICILQKGTAYGYQWRYASDTQPDTPIPATYPYKKPQYMDYDRSIRQYDKDGHYLNTFANMNAAAESLQGDSELTRHNEIYSIRLVCRGKNATAYSYQWRYADMTNENEDIEPVQVTDRTDRNQMPVFCYTRLGKYLGSYPNIIKAAESIEGHDNAGTASKARYIRRACEGQTACAYSYQWRYQKDAAEGQDIGHANQSKQQPAKPVCQYSKTGMLLQTFPSVKDAAESIHSGSSLLSRICNIRKNCSLKIGTAYSYQWRYEDDRQDIKT